MDGDWWTIARPAHPVLLLVISNHIYQPRLDKQVDKDPFDPSGRQTYIYRRTSKDTYSVALIATKAVLPLPWCFLCRL